LHKDKDDDDWPDATTTGISQLSFDSANRKLYVVNSNIDAGWQTLENVIEVDVDSWNITDYWDDDTSPDFHDVFWGNVFIGNKNNNQGESYYVPISTIGMQDS
ncbi:MAG: hypothetical protein GWN62_28720, partial [Aliifodinibius sp.]|nr:hypothetical protein [Fodinibius sp.]